MIRLAVDTETTGMLRFGPEHPADAEYQPRMCQLGMLLLSPTFEVIERYEGIIKPDGWTVPDDAVAIHGLTTEICAARGVPVAEALAAFERFHAQCEEIIVFSPTFDLKILRGEIRRNNPAANDHYAERPVVDVMRAVSSHCKLPLKKGKGFKLPKLKEACEILLGIQHDRAHDAMADIERTVDLFRWLDGQGLCPVGKVPEKREAA